MPEELYNKIFEPATSNVVVGIVGVGAKLIVGPRGTGKTHQMRIAYRKCLNDQSKPLPIYVSFSKYYHLEPFLFKSSNAHRIFHTWVLCKILLACHDVIEELRQTFDIIPNETLSRENIAEFVAQAEKGMGEIEPWHDDIISKVTISHVIVAIESITIESRRRRAILMLDDAALTLTHEYMIEFFDIFRSLKTKSISPKASVYPGTTEYGPRFHIGQDAEKVDSWLSVEDDSYSDFMQSLFIKRFRNYSELCQVPPYIIELLQFAAFGIPRAFIVLLRRYLESKKSTMQARFNYSIGEQAALIRQEYMSLSIKMPQYKTIIEIGYELFEAMIEVVKEDNKNIESEKQITIGIIKERDVNSLRMIKFLIEAGLLFEHTPVKHGDGREYQRFIPHLIFSIENRTFSKGRGFDPKEVVDCLNKKSKKHPIRRSLKNLIGEKRMRSLRLDLPPCRHCKAVRISEDQRFCHICGKEAHRTIGL